MLWLSDGWSSGILMLAIATIVWLLRDLQRRHRSPAVHDARPMLILVQNDAECIEGRLRGLLIHQSWRAGERPLAIIDLGSDDETPHILSRLARQYPGLICLSYINLTEDVVAVGQHVLQSQSIWVVDWRSTNTTVQEL